MKIDNYGAGPRCDAVMRELIEMHSHGDMPSCISRIIILPIPTSRDKVHITGTSLVLDDVLSDVGRGDLVVGYGISDVALTVKKRGGEVYDAMYDECFQTENSRVSAVGALGYILTGFGKAPSDMNVGIVGYGRIGSYLAELLLFLGARVRVYTTNKDTVAKLGACGVKCVYMNRGCREIPCIDGLDLIVNTAPTDLSGTFADGFIPRGLSVIDLASGKNFEGTCGVVSLQSIPEQMYPDSAGKIYFRAVREYILRVLGEV